MMDTEALCVTTDYATGTGCPEPYLRRIAEAGFAHIHWCHQWNTDFMYCDAEVQQIADWMEELDLRLLDLHGSVGPEKSWGSARGYERLAGVELVRNRIEMCARLGADVVIMHLPGGAFDGWWPQVRSSLEELRPIAAERGVRLALENGGSHQSFDDVERVLSEYGPEYLGLCYDSGHGNCFAEGLDRLDRISDRLISIHLHDNDGAGDQHKLLFTGTTDWPRLAGLLAASSYDKCVSMEVSMRNAGIEDEQAFLAEAYRTGAQFGLVVAQARSAAAEGSAGTCSSDAQS